MSTLTVEEVEAADAVVLVTDHAAFDTAMVVSPMPRYVLDTRHRLEGPHVEQL